MGHFNEKDFIRNNIVNHQDRIQSQVVRFLDTVPTYVTFYDINTLESTVNVGTLNVDRIWGDESPIRFNGVRNLPVYGVEHINPDLELNEEGMNVRYEGEGILLPNTVRAKPNSFFTMDVLPRRFVFRVTAVNETTINSNSYLRLSYELYATDEVVTDKLDKNTVSWYRCIPENIGTENVVMMLDTDLEKINTLKKSVEKISNYYKMLFYDKRYNSFLFNRDDGMRIYDRLLTRFMIDTGIFRRPKEFESIVLTEEDDSNDIPMEYYTSIFNAIIEKDKSYLEHKKYYPMVSLSLQSSFHHWRDRQVIMTRTGMGVEYYIRPELIDLFLTSEKCVSDKKKKCEDEDTSCGKNSSNCEYVEVPDIDNKPIYVSKEPVELDPYHIESETTRVIVDQIGNTVDIEPVDIKSEKIVEDISLTHIPNKEGDGLSFDDLFNEDEIEIIEDIPPTVPDKKSINLSDGSSVDYVENKPILTTKTESVTRTEPLDPRTDIVMLSEGNGELPVTPNIDTIVLEENVEPPKKDEWNMETAKVLPTFVSPNEIAEGENIMINTIIMYFGDCEFTLDDDTLDELMKPHRFIKNNHESFIITPIFIYLLDRLITTLTTGTIV